MPTKTAPSRTLIVGVIILIFLVVIAFVASVLTQRISQNMPRQASTTITPVPTQIERSVYLDLPASFPRDMPLPQGVKVTLATDDSTGLKATLVTPSPLEEVADFYATQFPRSGWTITSQSQAAGLTLIYAKKKNLEAIVLIGRGDQGVTVSITIPKS